jgi:hypothetical protein
VTAFRMYPHRLEQALVAEGLVPADCMNVQILLSPTSLPIIRYEIAVHSEQMEKLARAFAAACQPEREGE